MNETTSRQSGGVTARLRRCRSDGRCISVVAVIGILCVIGLGWLWLHLHSVHTHRGTQSTISVNASQTAVSNTSGTELSLRKNLESQVQQQLSAALSKIVGSGNAVVTVRADVTFNQVKSTSRKVQPAPGQAKGLISGQQVTSTTSNSTTPRGASTGTGTSSRASVPVNPTGAASVNSTSKSSKSETTKYDNGYVQTTKVNDPMQINGYSVGVFLNQADASVTPQVIAQIKQYVSEFVATTAGKGANNHVFVSKVPFQTGGGKLIAGQPQMLFWGELGLVAVALLLFTLWVRRKTGRSNEPQEYYAQTVQEFADDLGYFGESEGEQLRDQLTKLAHRKPDEFANLIRTWLVGE